MEKEPLQIKFMDVGIQVTIEEDEFLREFAEDTIGTAETEVSAKEKEIEFVQYIMENTETYMTGKIECLLCGEIKRNDIEMRPHMERHRGPRVLCSDCGVIVAHSTLMPIHNCQDCYITQKAKFIHCPLYSCRAKAISPLELYDHISEHTLIRSYHCDCCRRSFTTVGEFMLHVQTQLLCLLQFNKQHSPYPRCQTRSQGVYRCRTVPYHTPTKMVAIKRPLQYYDRFASFQQCQLCLQKFTSKFRFERHYKICLTDYMKRSEANRLAEGSQI